MLTGKQKRFLRSKAHHVKALFQVGKSGVNQNLIKQLTDLLEKRELIKVTILQNCTENKKEVANKIAKETNSHLVQIIGSQLVFYKESLDNKEIELPN